MAPEWDMSSHRGVRYAEVERHTHETRVQVVLDLDGGPHSDLSTGIGFLDHMLTLFAFHSGINLGVKAEGDLHIDDHHTVEDVGIALGQAIRKALANGGGFVRYGSSSLPMDDALLDCALDISGRSFLGWGVSFQRDQLGGMSTENVREFFEALCRHGGLTLHLHQRAGHNDHHICEAAFKAFARAFRQAVEPSEGIPSTKGRID
jgi:imidazoleglycerol-phosphate dehydratase